MADSTRTMDVLQKEVQALPLQPDKANKNNNLCVLCSSRPTLSISAPVPRKTTRFARFHHLSRQTLSTLSTPQSWLTRKNHVGCHKQLLDASRQHLWEN